MKISRRAKLTSALLLTLAGLVSSGSVAQASSNIVQPMALSSCTGGATYVGTAQQSLPTGILKVGFCDYSNHNVGTVNIVFQKTSGAAEDLDFGWNWDNSAGGHKAGLQVDAGDFVETTGQSKTYQWQYASPGIGAPYSSDPCFQGMLAEEDTGANYYTPTTCP